MADVCPRNYPTIECIFRHTCEFPQKCAPFLVEFYVGWEVKRKTREQGSIQGVSGLPICSVGFRQISFCQYSWLQRLSVGVSGGSLRCFLTFFVWFRQNVFCQRRGAFRLFLPYIGFFSPVSASETFRRCSSESETTPPPPEFSL